MDGADLSKTATREPSIRGQLAELTERHQAAEPGVLELFARHSWLSTSPRPGKTSSHAPVTESTSNSVP
jgi:hypothetical protein